MLSEEGVSDLVLILASSGCAIILKLLDLIILAVRREKEKSKRDNTDEVTTDPPQ